MKNLCSPELQRYRIAHPSGEMPHDLRPWAGAFAINRSSKVSGLVGITRTISLRVIASRGGGPAELYGAGENWDHVSVSLYDRCPTWEEMCFIKELFFERDEPAIQLHPVKDYINNHPYCLHLWRPLEEAIPLPPSILVGLPSLNL